MDTTENVGTGRGDAKRTQSCLLYTSHIEVQVLADAYGRTVALFELSLIHI